MGPKGPVVREEKEDVFQAILLADNFNHSMFGPVWAEKRFPDKNAFGSDDEEEIDRDQSGTKNGAGEGDEIEHKLALECLTPLGNRRLLDYSLEALSVSGVQEIFIYCSNGVKGAQAIKEHVRKCDLNIKIHVISSEDCQSLGDALRDLDGQGMIRNDFILMAPGVVTNTKMRLLLDEHRKTVKMDKGAVMTLIHRKMPIGHRSRSLKERQGIVIDSGTGKIITYANRGLEEGLRIPMDNLKSEMEIVMDTVDTGIQVCSASVLPLFTDNFDFKNIQEFVKNILINEEVMGHTIYLNQLRSADKEHRYAARVTDYDSFTGVSLDVLQRWSYPLVPDMPFGCNPGERVYQMVPNFVYKDSSVKTARDAAVGPTVVIGSDTVIKRGSTVRASSIGKHCVIGENAVITNSQLGDNVVVDTACKIDRCLVLDGSHIKTGMTLHQNMLIVGNQLFPIKRPEYEEESEEEDDDIGKGYGSDGSDGVPGTHQEKDFLRFCDEVVESLYRGFTDKVAMENLFVEIQGSRTANYMYFDDATVAVCKGILALAPKLHPDFFQDSLQGQWSKTKEVAVYYKSLLTRFVKNASGQENLLKTIEEYANDNKYFRPMTIQLLHYYYDEDILPQDEILSWFRKNSLYEAGAEIRKSVQKFVDWLEESDEDSDDE